MNLHNYKKFFDNEMDFEIKPSGFGGISFNNSEVPFYWNNSSIISSESVNQSSWLTFGANYAKISKSPPQN